MKSISLKHMHTTVLLTLALVLVPGLLYSCTDTSAEPTTQESTNRVPAGDSALPSLDEGYTYLLAKVVSKNPETDSVEVESLAWDADEPFAKSTIGAGEVGSVDCSKLVLYPGGINIGTVVVVACLESDGDAFPVTAYAIEKSNWFEERVDRWVNS